MAKEKTKEVVEINKKEINKYIDEQVKKYFSDEIDKANKRIIKYKNRKIIFRNIVILVLLIIILYLLHLLYSVNYFDKLFKNSNNKTIDVKVEKKKEEKELSLDELKEKYSYLLDNIKISENSDYLNDYYDGKLTDELKLYLVLNELDFNRITKENEYNIIDGENIKKEYNKLFDSEYKAVNFNYNDIEIRYISKMKSYLTDDILEKEESNIKREIIDIKVLNDEVLLTTIEGIVKDNTLYNRNNLEIDSYSDDSSLTDYEEDLNKVNYVFKNEKLKEIK